jgi:putrescine transport system substrate-binding protein
MRILAFALMTLALASSVEAQQARHLYVYNWSDYIDPKLIDEFQNETGIKVVYDTYDSNETLEAKLIAGASGYDLVFPSATFLHRQIAAGVLRPLDRTRLKNAANISKDLDRKLEVYDPGVKHSLVYMWFTTGIAFNEDKIRARLGERAIDTWDIVFSKDSLQKLSDCGVYFLDSPEDVFAIFLHKNKISLDKASPGDISTAGTQLRAISPFVKKYHSSEYISALANGDACLAISWAGDAFQAQARAREASNGVRINYVVPKEGSVMSMDVVAMPKDAKNLNEAYEFIDFLLRPDVAARNTNITKFANGVPGSYQAVSREIAQNPYIFPDDRLMKTLFTINPLSQIIQRGLTREWTRVKTRR